jgi:predicted Zn-dependent peptidase
MTEITGEKLANGLRVVFVDRKDFNSVMTGVYVKTGSRYENKGQRGISHFLEHISGSSTEKYRSKMELANQIESVGGDINAVTSTDYVLYYAISPRNYIERCLDVISQRSLKAVLKEADIKKERPIIIEEINRYLDIPEAKVFHNMIELAGQKHQIGQLVLGDEEDIKNFDLEKLDKFYHKYHRPSNMVLVISGSFDKSIILSKIKKYFDSSKRPKPNFVENFRIDQKKTRIDLEFKNINQAHFVIGSYGYGYNDSKRYAWHLLDSILGQGITSRLFQVIREKLGLSYNIGSSSESLSETGFQFIYGGANKNKLNIAIKAIMSELAKIKREGVTNEELKLAKQAEIGSIDIDQDDMFHLNQYYGLRHLLFNSQLKPSELKDRYNKVTIDQIKVVANEIYKDNRLNLAIIGPYKDRAKFEKVFKI